MLILFGAGGHCAEVLQVLGMWPVQVVVDLDEHLVAARATKDPRAKAMLASTVKWGEPLDDKVKSATWGQSGFIAVGDPRARFSVFERHRDHIQQWVAIGADRVVTSPPGGYLGKHAYLDRTAAIGQHVHINRGAMVAHDCVVGEFSHIAPGAQLLGGAHVGRLCEVGANAVILPKRRLAEGCRLGAGAVLTRDWDVPNAILRGNPARFVEEVHGG